MEFVDGIKVTDKTALLANSISPVTVSEAGLRLFVSQILDYGFFHADPHAGNILVKKDGKVVFIDFGLGKVSELVEEKGVYLLVFKKAINGIHHDISQECFDHILKGYEGARD